MKSSRRDIQFAHWLKLAFDKVNIIVAIAGVAASVATLSSFFTKEFFTFPGGQFFNTWFKVIALTGAVITILITGFVALLKLSTKKTTTLTSSIKTAYGKALDESTFNPHRLRRVSNDQLTD